MNEKEIARLEQHRFNTAKQVFTLRDDGTLLVTISRGLGNFSHYAISLAGWSPEFAHEKNGFAFWRFIPGLVVSFCIPLGVMASALQKNDAAYASLVFAGCLCLFILFWGFVLLRWLRRSYDVIIFHNPTTGGQLVLHYNVPNEKEFSEFVKKLQDSIKKHPYVSPAQIPSQTAELREFARLRDEGVITSEEFEETKRKLLSTINTSSTMGFRP